MISTVDGELFVIVTVTTTSAIVALYWSYYDSSNKESSP